ncbi:MAG: ABC transporter permease, partial [Alphaproteobacteria bacterium]
MLHKARLFRLEARLNPSRAMVYLSPAIAAVLTLVAGVILFAAIGQNPTAALVSFFIHPVDELYEVGELGVKAAPLCLCALGLAVGFRGNVWNIGADGQLTLGAICGGGLALALFGVEHWLILPAMLVAGTVGGALWGAVPALLRTRFNANEILTSLMLTYVAIHILGYLVHGPWRNPEGFNFPQSREFAGSALLPVLIDGTRVHLGVVLALVAVPLLWYLMQRSFLGFQIKVAGMAPRAADYAGYSHKRVIWVSLLLSGGLAGLAGICEVAGPIGQLQGSLTPGYGFAAIIVAFVGRLHPVGILFASLLMALL